MTVGIIVLRGANNRRSVLLELITQTLVSSIAGINQQATFVMATFKQTTSYQVAGIARPYLV